ncbi:uncharacterized protein BDV14DRAFT_206357 [Aspergillus stella-maris]|uniref:uncharacterized protein n=1 Tax=Aspergillus stella-maris TaxID=1810926 RepID=UPI003CCDB8EA
MKVPTYIAFAEALMTLECRDWHVEDSYTMHWADKVSGLEEHDAKISGNIAPESQRWWDFDMGRLDRATPGVNIRRELTVWLLEKGRLPGYTPGPKNKGYIW